MKWLLMFVVTILSLSIKDSKCQGLFNTFAQAIPDKGMFNGLAEKTQGNFGELPDVKDVMNQMANPDSGQQVKDQTSNDAIDTDVMGLQPIATQGGVQEYPGGGTGVGNSLMGGLIQSPKKGFFGGIAERAKGIMGGNSNNGCSRDVTEEYQKALYDFTMRLYKKVALHNKDHFAISPLSIWVSLAALAEGADGVIQRKLFSALNLPEDMCFRESYYKLALSRETSGNDVRFVRRRLIVMDQGLRMNNTWVNYIKSMNLLDISFAPIRDNPQAVASQLRDFIGASFIPRLAGNSILLDSLNYEGLWTTAFPESSIERAPFYDDAGHKIGMVDYLKMKKRVRLAHIPLVNAKVLELPVGNDGRYKMLVVIGLAEKSIRSTIEMFVNSIITEILANLKESFIPLEIAIPRFAMNFEYDANVVTDEIGLGDLWKNPEASWLISYPPAQPSGLYQRVSFKIDSPGLKSMESPNILNPLAKLTGIASNMATGLAAAIGRDFIANRPFMYSLLDSETNSCILAGAYSQPSVYE